MIDVEISGADAIRRELKRIEAEFPEKILNPVKRTGAGVIAKAVRRNTPTRYGFLKRSIKSGLTSKNKIGKIFVDRGAVFVNIDGNTRRMKLGKGVKMRDARGQIRASNPGARFIIPDKYAPLVEYGARGRPGAAMFRRGVEQSSREAVDAMAKKADQQFAKL